MNYKTVKENAIRHGVLITERKNKSIDLSYKNKKAYMVYMQNLRLWKVFIDTWPHSCIYSKSVAAAWAVDFVTHQ